MRTPEPRHGSGARFGGQVNLGRHVALVLAWMFLALALVGIAVPGLPTVPFLLLAAWFSARGSARLHRWIYQHPHLGKLLIDWETQKAISRRSKVLAVLTLAVGWVFMYQSLDNTWGLIGITVLFVAVTMFLASRPEPR